MKIGILTFHWATNYGAVLQCYALQTYLESLGHSVKVINYKPTIYDESIYTCIRYRKFLRLREYLNSLRKEKELIIFRNNHLNLTEQIRTCASIEDFISEYDLLISGSDQVANPFFLKNGEGPNIITPTYFLGFPYKGKRVGYALSFGCTTYPEDARRLAIQYINSFDAISVREKTGVEIVKSMGRNDAIVVPDPTLLMESCFYHSLADESTHIHTHPYIYCFFIRNINNMKSTFRNIIKNHCTIWNNDDRDFTIQGWLRKIKFSNLIITDSFHCMVMCLKLHKPFIIITEQQGNIGMNDRVYTLLNYLCLTHCIYWKNELNELPSYPAYNWSKIDKLLSTYKTIGENFLANL